MSSSPGKVHLDSDRSCPLEFWWLLYSRASTSVGIDQKIEAKWVYMWNWTAWSKLGDLKWLPQYRYSVSWVSRLAPQNPSWAKPLYTDPTSINKREDWDHFQWPRLLHDLRALLLCYSVINYKIIGFYSERNLNYSLWFNKHIADAQMKAKWRITSESKWNQL